MSTSMTHRSLLHDYLQALLTRNCRPQYITSCRRTLELFIKHTSASLPTDITTRHVSEFIRYRFAQGISDITVKHNRAQVCAWLNWASSEEYIPYFDWSRRVPRVKCDEKRPVCLDEPQIERLMTAVECMNHRSELTRRRDRALFLLLLDTGIREAELLRLKLGDVDIPNRSVRISAESKSRRERTVWFTDATANALRSYLRIRRNRQSDVFWVTEARNSMGKSNLLRIVVTTARFAGIARLTVHGLRHTAATRMFRRGMSLPAVSAILGHKDIATTARIYLHLLTDDVRREYEDRIAQAI